MALPNNSSHAFPANSVVETLFGIRDLRVPSIVPTEIRQETEPSSLVLTTSKRHAVDPVIRRCPPLKSVPKNPRKLKSVRSRSCPCRNDPIWQEELPNPIPRIPKRQPNITVPSHIVPPRPRPMCRWNGRAALRKKPPARIPVSANNNRLALESCKKEAIENNEPVSANVNCEIGKTEIMGVMDEAIFGSETKPATAIEASYPQELTQLQTEFHNPSNEQNCSACQTFLRESCEIISAKDKEIVTMQKELQKASAYNLELKSLILEQCEDLRKTLSDSQHWGTNRENAPAADSVLSISKLRERGFCVDPDPEDGVTSTPTSDFRLKRNMAWLKEQQDFLPGSNYKNLSKSPEKNRNTESEVFPELVTLHKRKEPERLVSKPNRRELDKMEAQNSRSRSRSRGTLKADANFRSRSVPSPVFRFQFGCRNPAEMDPENPGKEIKYLRIALAARQSFLKELRHRVHKAHTIFTRHQLRTTSKVLSTDRLNELLDSHNTFVKWLYNFISKGVHDIQIFDELNIFVNEQKELKYYFETTHNHNGNLVKGIFVPIPFNKKLISEVRQNNLALTLKNTQSIGCQCEYQPVANIEPDSHSKSNSELKSKVNKTTETKTSAISTHVPAAQEISIQTSRIFTAEQQNQTSRASLFEVIPKTPAKLSKVRSIFQVKHSSTNPTILAPNVHGEISTTEGESSSKLLTSTMPAVTSNYAHCDELSICDDMSEKSLNFELNTFSSSNQNGIFERPKNDFESSISTRKSVSFKDDDESRASNSNEVVRSVVNTSTETIYTPSTHPSMSTTSFAQGIAGSKSDNQNVANYIANRSVNTEPVQVRASVTEENIRKKIESITDMIRQFRSESFKSAGPEAEVNWTKVQDVVAQKAQSKQDNAVVEQEPKNLEGSVCEADLVQLGSSEQEFHSFTGLSTPSNANTVIPNTAYKLSPVPSEMEGGEDVPVHSSRISNTGNQNFAPSHHDTSTRTDDLEESMSIQTIFGKSFDVLNDTAELNTNSVSPFFGDLRSASVRRSAAVLPGDTESFLKDHFDRLRRELLSSESFQTPYPSLKSVAGFQTRSEAVPRSKPTSEIKLETEGPVLNRQEDVKDSVTSTISSHSPSKEAQPVRSNVVIQSQEAEAVLEAKAEEPKVPKTPGKSRIPIPTASPRNKSRPSPPVAMASKCPQSMDKKVGSNSYPCSPRSRLKPLSYIRKNASKRTPTPTPTVMNRVRIIPALLPRSGPPENRIIPAANYNRFGFKTQDTKVESSISSKHSKPHTVLDRNRNLQESEVSNIASSKIFPSSPNPQNLCNYTTEYGAAFNSSLSTGSRITHLGNKESPIPAFVRSKTLAANFSFSSS